MGSGTGAERVSVGGHCWFTVDLMTGLILLVFSLVGGIVYLVLKFSHLEVKASEAKQAALDAYSKAQEEVREQASEWAQLEAKSLLKGWMLRKEKDIRADAIARSKAVVKGKVVEQLVPFMPDFDYDPRDSRFLGSPVDLIVFDGLTKGSLQRIVFLEIKTGKSAQLSKREQQIQDVVDNLDVEFEVVYRR